MNTISRRQSALLGLFIAIGIAILVGTLFSIGTLREGLRSRIPVTATFSEVKGLKPGDAVWFAGVNVGTVKRVGFEPEGSGVRVELRIDGAASTHIPHDVLARIGSDSLIGNTIVVLYDGTEGAEPLEAGDELEIGSSVSPEDIMAKFQQNNENLLVITKNLKDVSLRLVDEEGSVSKLLSDDHLYNDISETVAELQKASVNAQILTDDVKRFTAELNTEGNLPHDLVTDKSLHASLVASTTSLEEATASASKLLESLETDLGSGQTPAGVLLHDKEAGADVEETLKKLKSSSELLEEDLEALQHNFLLRGYFKKKERREAQEVREAEATRPD
ncbi:MAG: MlaD family protein [Myxococcota bacterium]